MITPTVATEALFMTCLIDAMVYHPVVTVEIPGPVMQANMEGETLHMKMEGRMFKILTKLEPELYHKYIQT